MLGKNILLVAQEDDHSVATMLSTYAAWTKGATEEDVARIKLAMERSPDPIYPLIVHDGIRRTPGPPEFASNLPVERDWGRLSWRKYKAKQGVKVKNEWRSGRDSNPRPPA